MLSCHVLHENIDTTLRSDILRCQLGRKPTAGVVVAKGNKNPSTSTASACQKPGWLPSYADSFSLI